VQCSYKIGNHIYGINRSRAAWLYVALKLIPLPPREPVAL